jgi:hypothetical protein
VGAASRQRISVPALCNGHLRTISSTEERLAPCRVYQRRPQAHQRDYMACLVWLRSWDWWGNLIYLLASMAFVFLDISSGFFLDNPNPPIMTEPVAQALWLIMAVAFLVDALIYMISWFSYARREARAAGTAVRRRPMSDDLGCVEQKDRKNLPPRLLRIFAILPSALYIECF